MMAVSYRRNTAAFHTTTIRYCEGTDCLTVMKGLLSLVPIYIYVTCRKTLGSRGWNFGFHKVRATGYSVPSRQLLASRTCPAAHDCLSLVHHQRIVTVKTDRRRICRVRMQFAFPLLYNHISASIVLSYWTMT